MAAMAAVRLNKSEGAESGLFKYRSPTPVCANLL